MIYVISIFSFTFIGYVIYKFSIEVTIPISQLTEHTKNYKKAKGLKEKQTVIQDIKNDPIFLRTQKIIEREQLEQGYYNIKPSKRLTINKRKNVQNSFHKKQTRLVNEYKVKAQEVMKMTKGVDTRSFDEIDELKKIFYQFFVLSESNQINKKPNQEAKLDVKKIQKVNN